MKWIPLYMICWSLVLGGTAAMAAGAAPNLSITDCGSKGLQYDPVSKKCVASETAVSAAQLMLPMLGVHGDIMDNAELVAAVGDAVKQSHESNLNADGSLKDTKGSGTDNTCSNGIYYDGCEDGSQRMCSLVPDERDQSVNTRALWWPVLLWVVVGVIRCIVRRPSRRRSCR